MREEVEVELASKPENGSACKLRHSRSLSELASSSYLSRGDKGSSWVEDGLLRNQTDKVAHFSKTLRVSDSSTLPGNSYDYCLCSL